MDNEKLVLCYIGKTLRAIENSTPKREDDFINFLYNPETKTVILHDSKGKTVSAHRVSNNNDKEYLQGKPVRMESSKLDKIVGFCTQEFFARRNAYKLLGEYKSENPKT